MALIINEQIIAENSDSTIDLFFWIYFLGVLFLISNWTKFIQTFTKAAVMIAPELIMGLWGLSAGDKHEFIS